MRTLIVRLCDAPFINIIGFVQFSVKCQRISLNKIHEKSQIVNKIFLIYHYNSRSWGHVISEKTYEVNLATKV